MKKNYFFFLFSVYSGYICLHSKLLILIAYKASQELIRKLSYLI